MNFWVATVISCPTLRCFWVIYLKLSDEKHLNSRTVQKVYLSKLGSEVWERTGSALQPGKTNTTFKEQGQGPVLFSNKTT
uniref:Uncharacterized protein n=1 Tax=Anguilla anguilla TaxID=7936 RepID=A0A0E9WXN1_ANGAN